MKKILCFAFIMVFVMSASKVFSAAVLEGGGILYGKRMGFVLSAPKGWVFDNSSGLANGLRCVMEKNSNGLRCVMEKN